MTPMQQLLNQLRDERSKLSIPIEWDRCYQAIEMVIENTYLPLELSQQETLYTKEDVLKAGEIGEINHYDYKHIVSLLDEAKAINQSLKQPKKDNYETNSSRMVD